MKTFILVTSSLLLVACLSCGRNGNSGSTNAQPSPAPQADARAIAEFTSLFFADQSLEEIAKIVQPPGPEPSNDPFALFRSALEASRQGNVDEAKKILRQVLTMPDIDSRIELWAWKALRDLGEQPPADIAQAVRGVVCELHNEAGVGTIAAYDDGSARWVGGQGNVTVWDAGGGDAKISAGIKQLLKATEPLVKTTPFSEQHKTPPPERDHFRVSILTFGGIHTIESFGPDIDEKHPLARVLVSSSNLVEAISKKSQEQNKK